MKRISLLLFLFAPLAMAQPAARVDVPIQTAGPNVPSSGGPLPQALWVSNAKAYLCAHPSASLEACQASLITTYTDSTEGTACPPSAQMVQLPGSTCTLFTGVTSNLGAWVDNAQIPFDYWVVASYGTFGPFTFNSPSNAAAANPAGPSFAVNFANAPVNAFQADPQITITPSTHQLNLSTNANLATGLQAPTSNAAVITASVLAYGAVADVEHLTCSDTASSATLTCSTATFTSAYVGKYVSFWGWTNQPFSTTPSVAQISTVTDGTHVVLNKTFAGTNGSLSSYIGTDNVPFFNLCNAAVHNKGGGKCTVPNGSYLLATTPYSAVTGANDTGDYGQPAGGTGATVTCTLSGGALNTCSIGAAGSGYTPSSTLQTTITGGCGTYTYNAGPCGQAWVTVTTNGSGQASAATVVYPGFGFSTPPTVTIRKLGGDGATATCNMVAGSCTTATVGSGGAGYLPSSTVNVYGIGGASCATTSSLNGQITTAIGHGNTNASGVVTSVTMTNTGSGCAGTPTLVFGDFTCGGVQCTNIAPLNPIQMPVQIATTPGVSWEGQSTPNAVGVKLYSIWDGKSFDLNEPIVFGNDVEHMDMLNLDFENYWFGIIGQKPFSGGVNFASLNNLIFDVQGAFGMWTSTLDQGTTSNGLQFFGNVSWVTGGLWTQRGDSANADGGYLNAQYITNMVSQASYNAAIDDFFGSKFWGAQYKNQSGFAETCASPLTPALRQTDPWIPAIPTSNLICYRGVSSTGFTTYSQGGGGGTPINGMTVKGTTRYMLEGDLIASQVSNVNCENCTPRVTDPYRAAGTQEGGLVVSSVAGFDHIGWASGAVTQAIWLVANGTTTPGQQNSSQHVGFNAISCIGCVAQPAWQSLNYIQNIQGYSALRLGIPGFGAVQINQSGNGIRLFAADLATPIFDANTSNLQSFFLVKAPSFQLNAGTALTGNQGSGLLLQHSTGTPTAQNLVKFDGNGNTADSTIPVAGVPQVGTSVSGQAACWTTSSSTASVLGHCTTVVSASGGCTCVP